MEAIPLQPYLGEQVLQKIIEQVRKDDNNANLALRALGLQTLNSEFIDIDATVYWALEIDEVTGEIQVQGESISTSVANHGAKTVASSGSSSGRTDTSATTPPGQVSSTSMGGGDSSVTNYEYE